MCLTHRSYSHKIIMSLNTLQIACLITSLEQYESIINIRRNDVSMLILQLIMQLKF